MTRLFFALFVMLGAVLPVAVLPLSAQEWDCADAGNLPQQGMNYCAWVEFEKADRALNVAWKQVYPEMQKRDEAHLPELQGGDEALLEAQRAWLTYRDKHCEAVGFEVRGGSLEPLLVAGCKTHLTQTRTQELLLLIETY